MGQPALKFIPIASAWCSPTLEKLGAAIEAEIDRLGQREDSRSLDAHAELRDAFDLICKADEKLINGGWYE